MVPFHLFAADRARKEWIDLLVHFGGHLIRKRCRRMYAHNGQMMLRTHAVGEWNVRSTGRGEGSKQFSENELNFFNMTSIWREINPLIVLTMNLRSPQS